ncbi:MAG: hypothetical protein M8467_18220 [Anaerolineae bacterium]|nr:hypothetical protein [Anaerolineae bacterium]
MERVLEFLTDYQWWIYGILGLILLFYLRRALLARREGSRSIFKLEQEQARLRYTRSVITLAAVLLVMAAVFFVSNPVGSVLDPTTPVPTATLTSGPLTEATLTATPPQATMTPTATATQVLPTRPVRPTDTPAVAAATDAPVVRPAACPDPNVRITSPGVNQTVQGNVAVRGTANHENFQYYKIEVGPGGNPGDQQWTVVGQLHYGPVNGGVLETLNSGAYPPGTYTLRLVVVDQTGNFPQPCQVTISIQR